LEEIEERSSFMGGVGFWKFGKEGLTFFFSLNSLII
jgi:hypothetical protein